MLYVETCHPGRNCRDGGEYGFGMWVWRRHSGIIVKEYGTTCTGFDFCSIYGHFMKCEDCPDYDRKESECVADYQQMTEEELAEIAKKANISYEELIRLIDNNEEHEIDLTGHDYVGCRFEGGCIICYPCNHGVCWTEEVAE